MRYWLDSGTLLHLMRDGYLPEHDEDLDVNIWEEELPELLKAFPLLESAGYVINTFFCNGIIFKYNCNLSGKTVSASRSKQTESFTEAGNNSAGKQNSSIKEGNRERVVDINIYRKSNETAVCPMYYFKINPSKKKTGGRGKGLSGKARELFRGPWKMLQSAVPLQIDIAKLPWRPFLNLGTWQIPSGFFENIIYNEELGAYIPADWENYLQFRYGNWKKPLRDWVFYRDDGAISEKKP